LVNYISYYALFNLKILLRITFIIAVLSFIVSCEQSPYENEVKFQAEYTLGENGLDYEFILENEPGIEKVYVVDTLLFTIQSYVYDWGFKVFNKKDLKFLGEFGDRDGPDMVLTPHYNGQFWVKEDGIKVGISDNNRPIWWLLNLSKSIESGKSVFEKKVSLPNGDGLFLKNYQLSNNIYVGNTIHTRNKDVARLKFIDLKNDSIWISPLLPNNDFVRNLSIIDRNSFYGSDLIVSPNGDHIVSAMYRHNRIDFYTGMGEYKKSIIEKNKINNSKVEQYKMAVENGVIYYGNSFVTSKFFLITYYSGMSSTQQLSNNYIFEIRAFNYDGVALFKIKTPYKLKSLSLDLEFGQLYGYVYDEQSVIKINIIDQLNKFNLL